MPWACRMCPACPGHAACVPHALGMPHVSRMPWAWLLCPACPGMPLSPACLFLGPRQRPGQRPGQTGTCHHAHAQRERKPWLGLGPGRQAAQEGKARLELIAADELVCGMGLSDVAGTAD